MSKELKAANKEVKDGQKTVDGIVAQIQTHQTNIENEKEALKSLKTDLAESKAELRASKKLATVLERDINRSKKKATNEAERKALKIANDEINKEAAEKRKAAKARIKKEQSDVKAASAPVEQNGVKRPKKDSIGEKVWGLADQISKANKQPVALEELLAEGTKAGLKPANIKTQYKNWAKFFGLPEEG